MGRNKSNVKGLRFHDLRHEAVSRFFEMALISGHKDVRQLFRYTHLKPENLIAKYSSILRKGMNDIFKIHRVLQMVQNQIPNS